MITDITETTIILDSGMEISKEIFESWLIKTDRLNTEENYSEAGEHKQKLGVMEMEDYYQSPYLKSDLKDFIEVRDVKTGKLRNMYDIGAGLKKLLTKINY